MREVLKVSTAERTVVTLSGPIAWPVHWTGSRSVPCRQTACQRCLTSRPRNLWVVSVGYEQHRVLWEAGMTSYISLLDQLGEDEQIGPGLVLRLKRRHTNAPVEVSLTERMTIHRKTEWSSIAAALSAVYNIPPSRPGEAPRVWLARILPPATEDPAQLHLWDEPAQSPKQETA